MPVATVFKVADIVSANLIDALRFAAFLARLAEHHSAEGTAPRSPSRHDEAIAPRGRLVPDKRQLLLLARQHDLRPRAGHEKVFAPFPAHVCCFPQRRPPLCGSTAELARCVELIVGWFTGSAP
jgi:hypothetical protein